jgi:regulator of sigma E protease
MIGLVQSLITVVLFVLILGVMVLVHELGHFVTARLAGVRVLEFGIGFPPRARVLGNRGGTLYTLNWLPIGGFVKLEGEDGDDASDPRSFAAQGLPTQLLILVAGVVMNVLLAFTIFTAITAFASPYMGVRFYEVQPNSPASAAGLQPGEAIVAIDGERFQFLTGPNPLEELRSRAGQTIVLTIADTSGVKRDVTVTLRSQAEVNQNRGALGISGVDRPFETAFFGEYAQNDLPTAVAVGLDQTSRWMGLIVGGLGSLASSVATDPTAPPPVSGPLGIATQIGDIFWNSGPILTLYVAAILSANLAVVNILPFPPLDGGRMLVIILKRIFGRRISLRAERMTYVVGFVLLFAFLIWITGFDIVRIVGGGT